MNDQSLGASDIWLPTDQTFINYPITHEQSEEKFKVYNIIKTKERIKIKHKVYFRVLESSP